MKRTLLAVAFVLVATPALAQARNIVVFVADDHGAEAYGAYGNTVVKTPNLDQLAAEGVRFTHAFATTASCSASRSVILSGVHNHRNGQYGHEHEYHHFMAFENVRTLPVMLAEAGYRTARGGKYHVAPERTYHFQRVLKLPELEAFMWKDARPFFVYYGTHEPHRPFRHDAEDKVDPKQVIVPAWLPDIPEVREELALYYASVRSVDKTFGTIVEALKRTGAYDNTLIIYLSDNGAAFPGSKTNVYEPGIRLPLVVKRPGAPPRRGVTNDAMVSWVDLVPTVLEFAGIRVPAPPAAPAPVSPGNFKNETPAIQGRSFLGVLDQDKPTGWDEVYASHTFHEITMYYPMRVVRTRTHKLIWNIAHPLPYPFASDLQASKTWQGALSRGLTAFGPRATRIYLHRPKFELYDLTKDPLESTNLADDPKHAQVLAELKAKLKAFQARTADPWILKWEYE
jgi:N-sulfoglucosamine sulfohydrolase